MASLTWQAIVKTVYVSSFENNFEDWTVYAPHFEVSFRSLTWQVFLKTVYAAVLQVSFRSLTWQVFLKAVYAAVLQVSFRSLTWIVFINPLSIQQF